MVNVVLLLINGHIKDVNIPLDSKSNQKTFDKLLIDKKFNDKLNKNIENLGKGKLKKINTSKRKRNILLLNFFTNLYCKYMVLIKTIKLVGLTK